ncbi:MAG: hypothetical protein JWN04_6675 [Myxococcaceae bacterium]|nr:hypothetical protein [Myxococcaceae bacterium]
MSRFRCIGGDCESSCCTGGWRIGVDREHYEKTKHAMGSSPELRREFGAKVTRVKGVTDAKQPYALIVLQQDGSCGFFGEDRMCGLQKRYGEGVLSDTCTIYPRTNLMSGARHELAGVTSCPEVARQLLLHPDAMELDEVSPALFTRSQIHAKLGEHPADPYTRYHDELRNVVFDLLSDSAYPLSSRLSFVAYFANRTREFLYRGVAQLDEARLMEEIERILNPAVRAELHAQFAELPVDAAFASSLVLALVSVSNRTAHFRELLDAVIVRHSEASDVVLEPGATVSLLVAQILPVYDAQKRAWEKFAPRIDSYLMNYAKNYWAREWYFNSPDLLMHTVQLLLRMATVRFLLFGHPLMVSAVELGDPERELALSKAVVQTVQKFSRAFEHDSSFTRGLQDRLSASNVISLAHAACLASF